MTLSPPVATLLRHFHAHRPARIWSLIVTLYGDAVVPRGGSLWIGSLIELMSVFDVDAAHVRIAISRLSKDGWLSRTKRGRASYYRLSRSGEGEFLAATKRIYSDPAQAFDGRVRLALFDAGLPEPAGTRRALTQGGYRALSSAAFVGLSDPPKVARRKGLHLLRLSPEETRDVAAAAFDLAPVAEAYRAFVQRFTPLDAAARTLSSADAFAARILLIHGFRRIVLRDPGLPRALRPAGWAGDEARALTGRIYRRLLGASESWLANHATNEKGALPPADPALAKRFSVADQ